MPAGTAVGEELVVAEVHMVVVALRKVEEGLLAMHRMLLVVALRMVDLVELAVLHMAQQELGHTAHLDIQLADLAAGTPDCIPVDHRNLAVAKYQFCNDKTLQS